MPNKGILVLGRARPGTITPDTLPVLHERGAEVVAFGFARDSFSASPSSCSARVDHLSTSSATW